MWFYDIQYIKDYGLRVLFKAIFLKFLLYICCALFFLYI